MPSHLSTLIPFCISAARAPIEIIRAKVLWLFKGSLPAFRVGFRAGAMHRFALAEPFAFLLSPFTMPVPVNGSDFLCPSWRHPNGTAQVFDPGYAETLIRQF